MSFADLRSGTRTTLFKFNVMASLLPVVLLNGVPRAAELCERLRRLKIAAHVVHEFRKAGSTTLDSGLLDVHGDFATLYGLKRNFVCLIRPDGYVGLVQSSAEPQGLMDYLELICDAGSGNSDHAIRRKFTVRSRETSIDWIVRALEVGETLRRRIDRADENLGKAVRCVVLKDDQPAK